MGMFIGEGYNMDKNDNPYEYYENEVEPYKYYQERDEEENYNDWQRNERGF